MALFKKNTDQNTVQVSPRGLLQNKINIARVNLLIVIAVTVVNCILAALGTDTYFLFSAYLPYACVVLGMFLTGHLPDTVYPDGKDTYNFFADGVLYVMLAIAIVYMVLFFVCWLIAKKQSLPAMIGAIVLYAIDTIFMLSTFKASMIIALAFHVWVFYYLIVGLMSAIKLKKLPDEPAFVEGQAAEQPVTVNADVNADVNVNVNVETNANVEATAEVPIEAEAPAEPASQDTAE